MGKVKAPEAPTDKDGIVALLRTLNPRVPDASLVIYADAFLEYREAAENIAKLGTIVAHPRTASPIENPYTTVRDRAAARLLKLGLKTGNLWSTS